MTGAFKTGFALAAGALCAVALGAGLVQLGKIVWFGLALMKQMGAG